MVETRKNNGSYSRTSLQNEKLSNALLKKYESGWNPFTDEVRQKISESVKKLWANGTIPEKIKQTSIKNHGEEHWSKTRRGREFASSLHKGRKPSDDARLKMSISASKRVRTKRETHYTSARGGTRHDLNDAYFRSCWEANFARILNYCGKSWEYEPTSFLLSNGKIYTPDFLCEGVYYELKGRMTKICEEKLSLLNQDHPDVKIELIDGAKYEDLKVRYKNLIPLWEGK